MTGTIVSFSVMAVAGREISGVHDTFEIMAFRSIVGFAIVVLALTSTRQWGTVSRQHLSAHVWRNVFHFTGQNLWFLAIAMAPLAQVFALEFTSPLWAIFLAPLLLGDRARRVQLISALIGFVGVLMVTRPGVGEMSLGVPAAAASAIFFALTGLLTKRLTKVESVASIMFWLTFMQLVLGAVGAGYDGQVTWPTLQTWPWLVLIGMGGVCAHFCLSSALALSPIALVMPIDFTRLPVIAIVGAVLYDEALDVWIICGAAVIFIGNYMNIMSARLQKT
ncbi:DMT family transporter [Epibacterium ulvae]|nr:DMT family transporter [Epibacterium ulvae]MBT8156002.1 DMT family transporter [Epibacterium ulvae]